MVERIHLRSEGRGSSSNQKTRRSTQTPTDSREGPGRSPERDPHYEGERTRFSGEFSLGHHCRPSDFRGHDFTSASVPRTSAPFESGPVGVRDPAVDLYFLLRLPARVLVGGRDKTRPLPYHFVVTGVWSGSSTVRTPTLYSTELEMTHLLRDLVNSFSPKIPRSHSRSVVPRRRVTSSDARNNAGTVTTSRVCRFPLSCL